MSSIVVTGSKERYLLDTNVISETRKPKANRRVMQFIASIGSPRMFVSVLSFGELRRGAAHLHEREPLGAQRLSSWIDRLQVLFRNQTLPIDVRVAELWGVLSSDRSRPPVDILLAATALTHNLTLVSRNTGDFEDLPISILNPWNV